MCGGLFTLFGSFLYKSRRFFNFQMSFSSLDAQSLSALEGCVFDEIIHLFEHMRNDMLKNVISYVTDDVKARTRPYRKDK